MNFVKEYILKDGDITDFVEYSKLLKEYVIESLWTYSLERKKNNTNNENNEFVIFSNKPLKEFILKEFANDPIKTEYFVSYTINYTNRCLIANYDSEHDKSRNPLIETFENIDNDLLLDISFNCFKGKEIKKTNLSENQLEAIRVENSRLSMWGSKFHDVLGFIFELNELYSNKFEISFIRNEVYDIEGEGLLFEMKSFKFEKKSKNQLNEPTNNDKLKALSTFCPDLLSNLTRHNNDIKKRIIHLITGVNLEDCYKLLFTANKKKIDMHINNEIDELSKTYKENN